MVKKETRRGRKEVEVVLSSESGGAFPLCIFHLSHEIPCSCLQPQAWLGR